MRNFCYPTRAPAAISRKRSGLAAVGMLLASLVVLANVPPAQGQSPAPAPGADPAKTAAKPPPPAKVTVDRRAEPPKIAFISYANPPKVMPDTQAIVAHLEPFFGAPIKSFGTLDSG